MPISSVKERKDFIIKKHKNIQLYLLYINTTQDQKLPIILSEQPYCKLKFIIYICLIVNVDKRKKKEMKKKGGFQIQDKKNINFT